MAKLPTSANEVATAARDLTGVGRNLAVSVAEKQLDAAVRAYNFFARVT